MSLHSAVVDVTVVDTVNKDKETAPIAAVEAASVSHAKSAGSDASFQEARAFPSDLEISDSEDTVFEPSEATAGKGTGIIPAVKKWSEVMAAAPKKPSVAEEKPRLTKLVRRTSAEAGVVAMSPPVPTQRTIKTASGSATFFVEVGSAINATAGERRHKRSGSETPAVGSEDPFPNLRKAARGSPAADNATKKI